MHLIDQAIKLTSLPPEAETFLRKHVEQLQVKKNEQLLSIGQSCNYLYFVDKGILRGYYFIESKEVTNWFAQEGEFATCFYSFIAKKQSVEHIQALEDTELCRIAHSTLQKLYGNFPETERLGRLITENYYIKLEERLLSLQFKTARERYQNLMETKPSLIKRSALGQIASYLGITQETLSRMRAGL